MPNRYGLSDEDVCSRRIALAHREKNRTQGEILREFLLGPDDKRIKGMGAIRRQRARPSLKLDSPKDSSKEIQGRPRTARIRFTSRTPGGH